MVFASNLTTNTCFHSDQIPKYFDGTAIDFEDYHYKIAVITYKGGFHLYLFPFDFPFNYIVN